MYCRNFKPKIFTDITTPVKQFYSPNTGKKSQVLPSPTFMRSIYLRSEIVLVNDDITTTIELHVYSCYIVDFCTGDSTLVADEEVKLEKALEIA